MNHMHIKIHIYPKTTEEHTSLESVTNWLLTAPASTASASTRHKNKDKELEASLTAASPLMDNNTIHHISQMSGRTSFLARLGLQKVFQANIFSLLGANIKLHVKYRAVSPTLGGVCVSDSSRGSFVLQQESARVSIHIKETRSRHSRREIEQHHVDKHNKHSRTSTNSSRGTTSLTRHNRHTARHSRGTTAGHGPAADPGSRCASIFCIRRRWQSEMGPARFSCTRSI